MSELPFRVLLYRYFFFLWLFRDAGRGSRLERAAAWRHNQAQARWLPVYMRRWALCSVLLYALGAWVEQGLALPVLSACFYTPGVLCIAVNVVLVVTWGGLRHLPVPF